VRSIDAIAIQSSSPGCGERGPSAFFKKVAMLSKDRNRASGGLQRGGRGDDGRIGGLREIPSSVSSR
jgi:hypothetical protein